MVLDNRAIDAMVEIVDRSKPREQQRGIEWSIVTLPQWCQVCYWDFSVAEAIGTALQPARRVRGV